MKNLEKPVVYAGIEVKKEEEYILTLPPDHAIFPKVDMEDFDTEMEKCVIKCTWEANREQRENEEKKALAEVFESVDSNEVVKDNKLYDTESKV